MLRLSRAVLSEGHGSLRDNVCQAIPCHRPAVARIRWRPILELPSVSAALRQKPTEVL